MITSLSKNVMDNILILLSRSDSNIINVPEITTNQSKKYKDHIHSLKKIICLLASSRDEEARFTNFENHTL